MPSLTQQFTILIICTTQLSLSTVSVSTSPSTSKLSNKLASLPFIKRSKDKEEVDEKKRKNIATLIENCIDHIFIIIDLYDLLKDAD